jgi:hypothetical protein
MTRQLACLILVLAAASGASAADRYRSEAWRFTLTPPACDPAAAGAQPLQLAIFFLPATDGFSANVNVQAQPYADSLAKYDELSRGQFTTMKMKVLKSDKVGDNELLYEYTGAMQGNQVHWYSRAIKQGDHVLLITATALESKWAEQKQVLVDSVDSYKPLGEK